VLRLPEGSKFEPKATEGVYLETLGHGVYRVLLTDEDGVPRITESRHVTFDESSFPGAPALEDYAASEVESDESYEVESESDFSDDVSIDDTGSSQSADFSSDD